MNRSRQIEVAGQKYREHVSRRRGYPTIVNRTRYRSSDLRKFVDRLAERHTYESNRGAIRIWFEHISRDRSYSRQAGYCSGFASIGSTRLRLNALRARIILPRSADADRIDLAHVIAHEMGHLRGLNHSDMRGNPWYRRIGDWQDRYSEFEDYPLRERKPISRPKRKTGATLASERLAHCKSKVAEWESKRRRAVNAEKKWRRKARYYERRLAAMGVGQE